MNPSVNDTTVTSESLSHYADQVDTHEQLALIIVYTVVVSDSTTTSENLVTSVQTTLVQSDATTTSEQIGYYSDEAMTTERVQLIALPPDLLLVASETTTTSDSVNIAQAYTFAVNDTANLSQNESLDIIRNNARDIILIDSRIFDENGNALLDENGNFILDQFQPGDFLAASESLAILKEPLLLQITTDIVSTAEKSQVHIPPPFNDVETLTITIRSIALSMVVDPITIKIIIE